MRKKLQLVMAALAVTSEKAFAQIAEGHADQPVEPLITNDAVIAGMIMAMLGFVFWTSSRDHGFWKVFYKCVPMLLACYFLPSLLTAFQIVDPHQSKLYFVASRYLLPASLVLLTMSIDAREIVKLGPKAIVMFLTGTVGVMIGGPLAIMITSWFRPDLVGGDGPQAVWRGLSTVAGSWIGGGANQVAMKEVFQPSDELYSVMVAVDVIVAEVWMLFLLIGVGHAKAIDRFFRADASSVIELQNKMEEFSVRTARVPTTTELMVLLAIAFGGTGICHYCADMLAPWVYSNNDALRQVFGPRAPALSYLSLDSKFFWLIVLATTLGLLMSFTRLRNLEGVGASKIGTVFIFILVATIGLKMDILAVFRHPGLFVVGGIWMLIHVGLLVLVAYLIRAPYFFLAVGSKANIGGAASAPVVAAAFHPSLAPVGVLLAVLGYALGTYGAWLCALMMESVSPI